MKFLIALFIFSQSIGAAETPSWGTELNSETKAVTLTIDNNDQDNVECHYSISYLINSITFKKLTGNVSLSGKGAAAITFANDHYDHISRIHARVTCE